MYKATLKDQEVEGLIKSMTMTTTEVKIPGLSIIPDWISQSQHDWLVAKIDSLPWDNQLKRRTQHYGWRYRYDGSFLSRDRDFMGELPEWLLRLSGHVKAWLPKCDQVLVNEYKKGQRISAHIDHRFYFGETIISLSLCSSGTLCHYNHKLSEMVTLCL